MACALFLARQELEEELEDLSQWLALLQVASVLPERIE